MNMKNYKIGVLAPIPKDYIVTHNLEEIQKFGCATHTAIALAKLFGNNGTIIPVTHVKKADEAAIKDVFKPYSNISTDHITSEFDQGDVIYLKFVDQNKRLEKQTAFMNPIVPKDLKDLKDCDAFVIAAVTDFEVPLRTLRYIKKKTKAMIVFDAHGPTNALTITGDRLMKFWVDRDGWLPYIDVLKMNLEEAYCSWFEKDYHIADLEANEEIERRKLPKLAKHCLERGVKAVYITLDSSGVMSYFLKDGKMVEELVPSVKVDRVIDTTGCGDSFAGGLAFSLLKYKDDYIKAAQYGNAMGAQRTQGKTFEVFKSLQETEKMIKINYGAN